MKRWVLALILVLTVLVAWQLFSQRLIGPWPRQPRLQVGQAVVSVEVRDTPAGRNLGLSGTESLGENEGMLFIFEEADYHQFWMKDMNFNLDFIWINDGLVVDISEHIPAPDKLLNEPPMTISPSQPAAWILEVNSGWVQENSIKIGDRVQML